MTFIQALQLIAQLLPIIIEIIKSVEAAIPGVGKGEQKLAAVRAILESASDLVGGEAIKELWPRISTIISALVAVFNKTGEFNK